MNPYHHHYIAIDVAKESLRVQTDTEAFDISNDLKGFKVLLKHISTLPDPLVVFEASGGYERSLMHFLFARDIALRLVNPARVRAFADSEGVKAKSDPIDARVLLEFARQKKLTPMAPISGYQHKLTELMDRRSQLSEALAREKNRREKKPEYISGSIQKMISFIEKEMACIDQQIEKLIASEPKLQQYSQILQSVCGVGKVTAWTLLTYLHEISFLNRNQLVALAGIAPFDKESGKIRKKRRICAGRAKVRKCLYMAAQSAAVHNPVIRPYVEGLRKRGKPYKCAMVAAMRKLLIHLQSLLKNPQILLAH